MSSEQSLHSTQVPVQEELKVEATTTKTTKPVREVIGYVANRAGEMYQYAENYHPAIKQGLSIAHNGTIWMTQPILSKVIATTEPMIDTVDAQLVQTYEKALELYNEHLIKHIESIKNGQLREIVRVDIVEIAGRGVAIVVEFAQCSAVPFLAEIRDRVLTVFSTMIQPQLEATRTYAMSKSTELFSSFNEIKSVSIEKIKNGYQFVIEQADAAAIMAMIENATSVKINETSDYVMLKLKEGSEEFYVMETKLYNLLRSLLSALVAKPKDFSGASSDKENLNSNAVPCQAQ